MKYAIALTLMFLIADPTHAFTLDANMAAYVGGTIPSYNMRREPVEGRLDLGPDQLVFVPERGAHAMERIQIDYTSIRGLEFGQKAARRVPLAAGAMLLLGPFGLPALKAKRRAHQLTVAYVDHHGTNQVVVMALGKGVVRPTLAALELRSGITVEFQDEEARKWI